MCTPMISIIIPVYNTQKYILDCLNSLIRQTYQDFEVLLVNDGSTDASAQIITDYIRDNQLANFHLIHKENGGVSSARNLGLEHARGKWIAFIDSDDWAEPGYLQHMIEGLQKHPADFCMTGYQKFHEHNNTYTVSENPTFAHGNSKDILGKFSIIHPISKLYSASIIKKNHIRFDTHISVGEDRAFNFDYMCHTRTLLITEGSGYIYRIRRGSATTRIVRPNLKRGLSQHAFAFWEHYDDNGHILNVFKTSYHIAHNVLDSILCDILNAVIDRDTAKYRDLVHHPATRLVMNSFHHAAAPITEKTLVFLLKYRLHFAVKVLVKLYYSDSLNKTIRKLLKKDRK